MRRLCLLSIFLAAAGARADTLQVGPGKTYPKPCAALAAAKDGDVVEIDAAGNGSYDGDVCAFKKNRLTLRGVNGRAHVDAAGQSVGGKAIWVVQGDDTTVEDVELSGCKVADKNGAGIRQEGHNLTVRRCYFHDNEDGILESNVAGSEILVESSEFAHNGAGDGYSHNIYIGHCAKFTLQGSYSHHANVGHLVKSRAAVNYVLYNRLTDEADGNASYELDLPNGGTSYVIGNLIQQGQATENATLVSYLGEGANPANPKDDLYVINNTFLDQRSPAGKFLHVAATTPAIVRNNIFVGAGAVSDQAGSVLANNDVGGAPSFVDLATWDVHVKAGSPCINAGADPGSANGVPLTPTLQYVHTSGVEPRPADGTLDIGAYEYGQVVAADAGAVGKDAGPAAAADATPGGLDAQALPGEDAGASLAADAGTGAVSQGCGCSSGGPGGWAIALVAMAISVRACRRRSSPRAPQARAEPYAE